MNNKIKTLLVDNHPVFALGLEHLMGLEGDIEIVGMTTNGNDALSIIESKDVDIMITEICLPGLNGLDTAEIIKRIYNNVKIVFVTMYDNVDYIEKAKRIGVEGYIIKDEFPDLLKDVRGRGLMWGVEFHSESDSQLGMLSIIKEGVLLDYCNNKKDTLKILLPLVVQSHELETILEKIRNGVVKLKKIKK